MSDAPDQANRRVDRTQDVADLNPEAVVLDGWGDCIVGITSSGGAVYDVDKMIDKMVEQGSTHTDAMEFIAYNVERVLPYTEREGDPPVLVTLFHDESDA